MPPMQADEKSPAIQSSRRLRVSDEIAYIVPMAVFLVITFLISDWTQLLPAGYAIKTILAASLMFYFRHHYTKIRWTHLGLGFLVGVIGVVQWVGMEKGLLKYWPNYPRLGHDIFDPTKEITSHTALIFFMIFRLAGPALVVPFMEEYFWRDFIWRTFLAPNNFKMAEVGEWDAKVFWLVALLFASEHVQWITAIVWAIMIGLLLVRTKSLGACIVAHGVTNLLLGLYVLHTHDWWFW